MILNFNQHIEKIKESNFLKWFGNSKIIEHGKPLICYHGTTNVIKEFRISQSVGIHNQTDQLKGIYFTDNREGATYFTPNEDPKYLLSVYLSIQNPYHAKDYRELKNKLNVEKMLGVVDMLKDSNYDGIIIDNGFHAAGGPYKLFLAFYPTQVKSIKNDGS